MDHNVWLHIAGLHQVMRFTAFAPCTYKTWCSAVCSVSFQHLCCFTSALLLLSSPAVVSWSSASMPEQFLFDHLCWCCWVEVHIFKNHLVDPTCVPVKITINKLHFILKQEVSSIQGMLWNGRALVRHINKRCTTADYPRNIQIILQSKRGFNSVQKPVKFFFVL